MIFQKFIDTISVFGKERFLFADFIEEILAAVN